MMMTMLVLCVIGGGGGVCVATADETKKQVVSEPLFGSKVAATDLNDEFLWVSEARKEQNEKVNKGKKN